MTTTVNCPTCDAYYRVKKDRISARGAKLRCPQCSTIFLVFAEEDQPNIHETTRSNLDRFDFRRLGVDWQLRDPTGKQTPLKNLATLRWHVGNDRLTEGTLLAFNGGTGIALSQIDDLTDYFWDVFERARSGHLGFSAPMLAEDSLAGAPLPSVGAVPEIQAEQIAQPATAASESRSPTASHPSPAMAIASESETPHLLPRHAAPQQEVGARVYVSGSQSTGARWSTALAPVVAVTLVSVFVIVLGLAVFIPFARQATRASADNDVVVNTELESVPSTAGVVMSGVTAEEPTTAGATPAQEAAVGEQAKRPGSEAAR